MDWGNARLPTLMRDITVLRRPESLSTKYISDKTEVAYVSRTRTSNLVHLTEYCVHYFIAHRSAKNVK